MVWLVCLTGSIWGRFATIETAIGSTSLFVPFWQCFPPEKLNAQERQYLRTVCPFPWQGQLYNQVDIMEPDSLYQSVSLPWHTNFNSLASITVVLLSDLFFSVRRWLRLFFVSPQRFDPPCMLGMFRMAIPSREILIKSSWIPSHWLERKGKKGKQKKREKVVREKEKSECSFSQIFFFSNLSFLTLLIVNSVFTPKIYTFIWKGGMR